MYRFLYFLLILGATSPSITFAQNNNRISVQTGLFHSFFDSSPLLNTNYKNKTRGVLNGLFYNSLGIQYSRKLNSESTITIEYMYFYEYYWNVHPNLIKNVITDRNYNTFNLTYERFFPISKFNFTFGSGANYRNGSESIVVSYYYLSYPGFWESQIEIRTINDFGVNLRVGIEYSPLKWITFYSKFDLVAFVYVHDKKKIQQLKDIYGYQNYPHRFDLSMRFGVGFNF